MNILVVDDDPIVLASCKRVLETEGYAVFTASSVPEAVTALAEREYVLLLADIKMPEYDGYHLLGSVKKEHPSLPVIVMSGFPTGEIVSASLAGGALSFVPKPFTPEELLEAVRAAIRTSPGRGGEK